MTGEEELQGGIRNAVERGVPVDKVVQTFINAGYSPADVQAAARAATEGATTIAPQAPANSNQEHQDKVLPEQKTTTDKVQPDSKPISQQIKETTSQPATPKNNESKGPSGFKIILLVVILLVLLGALVASLLFREQILGLLS